MKRFLILPLFILSILISSCLKDEANTVNSAPTEPSVVLFVGLDDAAKNMDVLCFVSFDPIKNSVSFVQIPRDTYFDFGGSQNKINQLYAHYCSSMESREAMSRAIGEISNAFGVKTTGYVAITTSGLVDVIDALGGIEIEVKNDGVFTDEFGKNPLHLHAGVNHLEGASAVQFIRYRQGYLTGDLGRLDAQKLFFRALLNKIALRPSLDRILNAYLKTRDNIQTDMNIFDTLRMNSVFIKQLDSASVSYLTMPGEAAISENGISYYSLNKNKAGEVCTRYLFACGSAFDSSGRFLKRDELSFSNIYYDKNNAYRVYDNDSVADITVPKKH